MAPWFIMLLPTRSMIARWQSPQAASATRRSEGFTKRMNSADSWLSRTDDSDGLAEVCQKTGFLGGTWALRMVRPGVGSPPWQSVHPSTTYGDACMSSIPRWHSRHPALLRPASCGLWSIQLAGLGAGGGASAERASRGTAIGGPNRLSGGVRDAACPAAPRAESGHAERAAAPMAAAIPLENPEVLDVGFIAACPRFST